MRNIKVNEKTDSADDLSLELYKAIEAIADVEKVIRKLSVKKRNYVACDDPDTALADDQAWQDRLVKQLQAVKVEVVETSRVIYNQKSFEPDNQFKHLTHAEAVAMIQRCVKPKR